MSAQAEPAAEPVGAPVGEREPTALHVVGPQPPVARLGLLWATALLAGTEVGPMPTAVLVAPVAAVAAASVVRVAAGGRHEPRRVVVAAGLAAAAGPLAAMAGTLAAVAALVVGAAVVAGLARRPSAGASVLLPAAAAVSLVLGSAEAGVVGLGLASAACMWDLAVYTFGTGRVAGTVAGTAGVAVVSVLFAAIADPPLGGVRPWVLFGLVVVAAPAGVALAARVAGDRRLPALRRLDSMILAGPAWVVGTQVLLHH